MDNRKIDGPIITLCGELSDFTMSEILTIIDSYTVKGWIVLLPYLGFRSDRMASQEIVDRVNLLQKQKILISDAIVITDQTETTQSEIDLATQLNIPIFYYNPTSRRFEKKKENE